MTARRRAYLGIGSNLGDRLANLQAAVDGLDEADRVDVVAVSPVYETAPVGGPEQPDYLNAVVGVDTALSAHELLALGQRLESDAHRVRMERWGPRTLDVDVLLVGDEQVDDPDLQVPHPRMWERGFVMAPLGDIAPDLAAPRVGRLQHPADHPADRPAQDGWPGVHRTRLALTIP